MPESNTRDHDSTKLPRAAERMIRDVGEKQERIERAKNLKNGLWSSISMLGVVGWSVTLPTLLGVAVGVWLDQHWPGRISWTVTLLSIGLLVGCANAWFHVGGKRR